MGFMGYKRPDGGVGVRNHVVVMSSVSCANGVVNAIARELPELKPITHTEGCGRGPMDLYLATNTLTGLGKNPNVAAILVIGLGCEFIRPDTLVAQIEETHKPVERLIIQEQGGSQKTTRKGIEVARKLLAESKTIQRQECSFEQLVVGLECGGSDAMSGITANPMVGVFSDWLVDAGGRVILSETTEMIGTEEILSKRAATPELGEQLKELIEAQKQHADELLGSFAGIAISPGNMEGGLSSIQEKSLGCIVKAGTRPINDLVDYGEQSECQGLTLMDSPGSDIFSLTGMAAGGAQLIIFTTGMGTPAGFPIAPVIKVASNSELFEKMNDDMDIDAGQILQGVSLPDAGSKLVELVKKVANGEQTKAEINKQDLLAIFTVSRPF